MLTAWQAKYFAYELTKRCPSDSLQKLSASLADAQVDLNPHQIDAALFAFRSPLSKGAILADEVGLGKTIEAGILLSQKWAERKRKLLVIVPANLRKQWHQELADKFFLPAVIMETRRFNENIKQADSLNPFNQPNNILICSYQFIQSKETYVKQIPWDLVVIDEAHRLRNVYRPGNRIANAIKNAVDHAPKVLLTATPLQNTLLELFGLVSIIDDYTFGDLKSFKAQFSNLKGEDDFAELKARLQPICQRTLRNQVLEYVPFTNRYALVQEFYPTEEEQRLYDLVSDYLQRPELFALPASQRKLMTLVLRKLLASSTSAISGTLETLVTKLESIAQDHAAPKVETEELAKDFEALDEIRDEWDDKTEEVPGTDKTQYTSEDLTRLHSELSYLRECRALAGSIHNNSKGESLLTALKQGFEEALKRGAQKKAVIFTESTRTQIYVRDMLEATAFAGKVVLFNGSNTDDKSKAIYRAWLIKHEDTDRVTGSPSADMRAALVEYFRDEAEILIATEAAAEGINLQFCSLVVNYDLPWNPQRIEQRIGRCHRYGQKCDVVVVNFLNRKNAADQRVYQLLDEKFRLFSGVFGASDEVLGAIESGVDLEKRIADIYQKCRAPAQIEFQFNQLQSELEDQIRDRIQSTHKKLLEHLDDEVLARLRLCKNQNDMFLDKHENWLWLITTYYLNGYARIEHFDGNGGRSFFLERNPFPDEIIHPGRYQMGRNVEHVNIYRLGHPLAQRIISRCLALDTPDVELCFGYTSSRKHIAALDSLKGQSGWLGLTRLTVTALDVEDHMVFSALTDEGEPLDESQCQRLFALPASEGKSMRSEFDDSQKYRLGELYVAQKQRILAELADKNLQFSRQELSKLDRWCEDRRNSLKQLLNALEGQIRDTKRQARLSLSLADKLKCQRERRALDTRRDEAWRHYHRAATTVMARKTEFMDCIQKKMEQHIVEQPLFTLRWCIT